LNVFRVGSGHDTHRFIAGRPLFIGGVRIEHSRGLDGHSDADVLLHSVTDAILGALGHGDIGDAFPDTDPQWKNADSRIFLSAALEEANRRGWQLVNLDATLFAQEPKLGPLKQVIRENLAQLLGIPAECVNVKAKTGEKVGHIGRAEAMGCHVVVLLEKKAS
jgi:2-C-methyl-D-erythritol 2,4-cyclodiphosphate synthase